MSSTDDLSIVELRGAAFEWLGPSGRIAIHGVEYEYADSDADDDSIDDAVGPGRTFGKLVKPVAAPLEMFFSFCSDLLGNGPDPTFTRLMCRKHSIPKKFGRRRNLTWWCKEHLIQLWTIYYEDDENIERLVQFVIDRRYKFSVRLTAAYYLLILLQSLRSFQLWRILPLMHNALLRLCQEGSRRGINSSILKPLEEVVTFNEELKHIIYCWSQKMPDVIIGSGGGVTSLFLLTRQLHPLCYDYDIRTRSDLEAVEQALQVILSSLRRLPPATNFFMDALRKVVAGECDYLARHINEERGVIKTKEFLEHVQYTIPCGPGYGSRYTSVSCSDPGTWSWMDRAHALDSVQNLCPGCKHTRCPRRNTARFHSHFIS
ncbi:hypothetical protein OE88DRAFT_1669241 [Heliocybe sulcata]|uniref:Uncharacterized protein n=1 Tax=Heliocybe sulcata TaxID=5364 RepID=A0A5C3ML36_9AGAM|nr:hypothetical protein OE88DRAFT_1669241 [Heliocybe sulcata]